MGGYFNAGKVENVELTNTIPWSISILSLLFVILTFIRNGKKDEKEQDEKEGLKFDGIKESLLKANMKLDQVCATTNETRSDIKAMNTQIQSLDKELAIVKRDLKTAFNRIDELRTRGENNEKYQLACENEE